MGNTKKGEISCNSGPVKASTKLHEMMKNKITRAVEFASNASIYRADVTATELNTAQSILLSLMHSLLTNDLGFCVSLLELATTVDHLRSSYLPTWLKDDFNFDDQQVLKVLSRAAFLVQSGFLIIPNHILKVFVGLSPKYRVLECCRASGDTDTLKFLLEFNLKDYSFTNQSTSTTSSFSSNPFEMNRSNSVNIMPSSNTLRNEESTTFRTMNEPFYVNPFEMNKSNSVNIMHSSNTLRNEESTTFRTLNEPFYVNVPKLLINPSIQKSFSEGATKRDTFAEGTAKLKTFGEEVTNRQSLHNVNAQTVHNFLDDEGSFVERIENPAPSLQEVWVENSATVPAQAPTPSSINPSSSNELYKCTVREYLKVPEDFNEEELMSLITYSDGEGITTLHRAVKDGNPYVVECMLMLGAQVNEKDTFGSTPSHCAASIGSIPILQVLAQNQADFSLSRNDGCTPLHEAIINGHEAACRWLLDHGSDINIRNSDGWAPLHLAAQWNKQGIVKILLENGADPKIYNNNGKTPVDVAREEGHATIVELLTV